MLHSSLVDKDRYYLPTEVIIHNKPTDCWVSVWDKVFDITPLIQIYIYINKKYTRPLLAFAGRDISFWFDQRTREVKTYINPISGVEVPYLPYGYFIGAEYEYYSIPSSKWTPVENLKWWKNDTFVIGRLIRRPRRIKICNMLIAQLVEIDVGSEETIKEIARRYSIFNKTPLNYTWYDINDNVLDMNKTLEENGIHDERERFIAAGLPANYYIPFIKITFKENFDKFMNDEDGRIEDDEEIKNQEGRTSYSKSSKKMFRNQGSSYKSINTITSGLAPSSSDHSIKSGKELAFADKITKLVGIPNGYQVFPMDKSFGSIGKPI